MGFEFSVITGKQVNNALQHNLVKVVEKVKQAYLLHDEAEAINPNSYFLRFPKKPRARIIALPAYLGGDVDVAGIKWISSNPDNIKQNFPRASAVLILNDYETGYPFACLESSIISAIRTAASAVLAAEHINNKKKQTQRLGIVGTGIIAKYIYKVFQETGWDIEEVSLFDTQRQSAEKFTKYLKKDSHKRIVIHDSLESLLTSSDVIVLATSALEPYIDNLNLLQHNPILLNVSLRDLSPNVLLASNNVVDDIEHVLQANTSPHLTEQQVGHRDFINGTIAGLIKATYCLDENKPTVFSPMGMGILDLAVGKYVFDQVVSENQQITIQDFFYELER